MPNWCITRYVVEGPKERLETFEATLTRLENMPKSPVENGFGTLWLGNIVHLLGGDWNNIRCRGLILEHYLENGVLNLTVESAWSELEETRLFLLQKFPDIDIYYQSEEPGMAIFQTNDELGTHFPQRYVVDSSFDGEEYFEDLDEVAAYIEERTGIETEPTEASIRKSAADWVEKDPSNLWLVFHEFEYVA